jgi:hypothetical protein
VRCGFSSSSGVAFFGRERARSAVELLMPEQHISPCEKFKSKFQI